MGKTHIICYRRLMTLKSWQQKPPKIKYREKKRLKQNEQSFCNLWDNIKGPSVCVFKIPEGKERENGAGEMFDWIIVERFIIMIKTMNLRIWKAQCIPQTE